MLLLPVHTAWHVIIPFENIVGIRSHAAHPAPVASSSLFDGSSDDDEKVDDHSLVMPHTVGSSESGLAKALSEDSSPAALNNDGVQQKILSIRSGFVNKVTDPRSASSQVREHPFDDAHDRLQSHVIILILL